jgi:major type 1 subunit fimbrin (pilin)
MQMKKTLLTAAMIAVTGVAVMAPRMAGAVDGTITVNGTIVSNTCKVGSGSPNNFTVTLPTISTSALTGAGAVAAATPFSIAISGCGTTGTPSKVTAYFEPGSTIDTATGNLINQAASGGSTGVEVRLLNGSGSTASAFSAITLGAASGSQNSGQFTISASGTATMNYYAEYYQSLAAVGAGSFTSSVQYTMLYQ